LSGAALNLAALVLLVGGIVLIAYVLLARRRTRVHGALALADPAERPTWTRQAGEGLGELSESARCDLVFAVGELDDDRSRRMLVHALADPSSAVSLAAAHALARQGHIDQVQAYAASARAERSKELLELLALIG